MDPRALFNEDNSIKTMSQLDEATAVCIQAIEQTGKRTDKVRLTNQLHALELLARYHKLFAEDHTPTDLGVKVIIMDAPRPPRPVAPAASTQLPLPETRSDVIEAEEYVNAEGRHSSKQAR